MIKVKIQLKLMKPMVVTTMALLFGNALSNREGQYFTDNDVLSISALNQTIDTQSCQFYASFEQIFDYCGTEGYVK